MADTGAPHFIPYVEPTDLVRDYPAADEASADAIAAALDAIPVLAGIGSNVVQTVLSTAFTTASNNFVDITGLTATITPTSSSSKILVIVHVQGGGTIGATQGLIQITRGGSAIYIGDASGSRSRITGSFALLSEVPTSLTPVFLDAPATTSATTYAVQTRRSRNAGTIRINRAPDDGNSVFLPAVPSSITIIEVAA